MDLIDFGLIYLNQIIIMAYEAQVRQHKYIYMGLDDFKTLALSLSYTCVYIYIYIYIGDFPSFSGTDD